MGVCAQSNIMSDELTCYDHLRMFAQLKGIESSDVDTTVCYDNLIIQYRLRFDIGLQTIKLFICE